jgi:hypothetical protein
MPERPLITARPHRLLRPMIRKIGELNRNGEPCLLLVTEQLTCRRTGAFGAVKPQRPVFHRGRFATRLRHRVTASRARMNAAAVSGGTADGGRLRMEACGEQLAFTARGIAPGFAQSWRR